MGLAYYGSGIDGGVEESHGCGDLDPPESLEAGLSGDPVTRSRG